MKTLLNAISPSAADVLRMDHAHVLATFHQYHVGSSPARKRALVDTVCIALEIHGRLEEEIFYPALREVAAEGEAATIGRAFDEHATQRRLISALRIMQPDDPAFDGAVMELMRDVIHHVAEEETILLPAAELRLGDRLVDLGAEVTRLRLRLLVPRGAALASSALNSLPQSGLLAAAGAVAAGAYLTGRSSLLAPRRRR